MNKTKMPPGLTPGELIDVRIRDLGDWRGELLAHLRQMILAVDSDIVEEWKWNVPVWFCQGILCTGETYKEVVKLTFAHGAALPDPAKLFNSSLDGKTRRAIDLRAGAKIDTAAFQDLIRAAVKHNVGGKTAKTKPAAKKHKSSKSARRK